MIVVATSGGFDPVHVGHIRLFREAKALGDKLVVILNTDDFLLKKKGYIFMKYHERKEILESFKYVDGVIPCIDTDQSVAKTLEQLRPSIFAKGGDRTKNSMPKNEIDICKKLGIKIVYNIGGSKIQSSSWLINKVRE